MIRVMLRRIYWRIHWRLLKSRDFTVPFFQGLTIRLAPTSASSGIYINGGFSDPSTADLFVGFLRPQMVVLDCGAHIGEYTLLTSTRVGDEGSVHAFEPDPRMFRYLEQNVLTNRLRNVVLNRIALSDTSGREQFVLDSDAAASSLARCSTRAAAPATTVVSTTTLDAYARENRLNRVDALKIDVEGAEGAVIAGGLRVLTDLRPELVFIECHVPEQAADLAEHLRSLDYQVDIDENGGHMYPHLVARLGW
jgi:FkbM family methyltransferase